MEVEQVLDELGDITGVSMVLDVSYQAVQQWVEAGKIPDGRQWQLQALSGGKLLAAGYQEGLQRYSNRRSELSRAA